MNIRSLAPFVLALSACGSTPASPDASPPDSGTACAAAVIEADLEAQPLAGPAVDEDGRLRDPAAGERYVVSSTYLALRPEAGPRFGELVGPIQADLAARDGLLAISLGSSSACGTARTLTVWRDEDAMAEFVASDAHLRAMSAITEISRGGSAVTHWTVEQGADVTWASAAEHVGADASVRD